MKLLLDTCTFLWLAGAPGKISKPAAGVLDDLRNERHLSDVSIWEIVLKHSVGKISLPQKPRIWLEKQAQFFQLHPVPVGREALIRSGELPSAHADPFDRLLAAQALTESFQLVTPDAAFRKFGLSCIW